MRSLAWLNGLSVAWLGIAVSLALAAPWLALALPSGQTAVAGVALAVTAGLIVANLVAAWTQRRHTRRVFSGLPRTLLALALFVVLFVQVACHLGADYFESSAPPGPEDWLAFGAAHVLRAADFLDVIEKFDLNIQAVRHNGTLTGVLLVLFHLVTGLFVLDALARVLSIAKRHLVGTAERDLVKTVGPILFVLLGALLTAAGIGMLGYLALAENATTRLAPLPVAVGCLVLGILFLAAKVARERRRGAQGQILRLNLSSQDDPFRAHQDRPLASALIIVGTPVLVVLGFVLPVVLVISLKDGVQRYGFSVMGGWALDNVLRAFDFADVMSVFDLRVHRVAGFRLEPFATLTLRLLAALLLVGAFHRLIRRPKEDNDGVSFTAGLALPRGVLAGGVVGLLAVVGPFLVVRGWPAWGRAAERLAEKPPNPDHRTALARMGPRAAGALPVLESQLPNLSAADREDLVRTFGSLGPAAVPILERLALDPDLAESAAAALGEVRPLPVETLVKLLPSTPEQSRTAMLEALRHRGRRAVPALRDALTIDNAAYLVPLLDEAEPYWYLPTVELNPEADSVRKARIVIALLREPSAVGTKPPFHVNIVRERIAVLGEGATPGDALPCIDLPEDLLGLMAVLDHYQPDWPASDGARRSVPQLIEVMSYRPDLVPRGLRALDRIDPTGTSSRQARERLPESARTFRETEQ